jgi:predicted ArsR family transcriptional regulator
MSTRDLASVSSLEDPVRRRLYDIVSARPGPVGRDEAAAVAGIGRPLAAYHLDKLVESGLLTVTYQRLGERSGPGAGRPAKLYARSDREFAVSVPPRASSVPSRRAACRTAARLVPSRSSASACTRICAASS